MDTMKAREVLTKYWKYDFFRPLQEEIITSIIDGKDTMALLPTGGGKSICYQVPGMMLEGLTIVITPLIALMRDQVDQLNKRGIRATALYSGMSSREIDVALDNCIFGQVKFLYVSPERLQSELFRARAERMKISLLAIDEAHCISQWGYDFRPHYLEIAAFRKEFDILRQVAVTATATKSVRVDILEKLEMETAAVFQKSFARENLSYSVFETENKLPKLLQVLQNVPGSSVVYVRSRKAAQIVASQLKNAGINADYYHAGMTTNMRAEKQQLWINDQLRVMVATNAFGMGIDKSNVRSVVHMDLPDSLEAYYQEAGRAGRDLQKAYAVLLYQKSDIESLQERIEKTHPSLELIKRAYQSLANKYKLAIGSGENARFEFDYQNFTETFNLPIYETHFALKKLENEGLISISDGYTGSSKASLLLAHEDLYRFQVEHAALDPLVKALLRIYGGELYEDYVSIKESEIARFLRISKKQVIQGLDHLHQINVIEYQKVTGRAQLTFLHARLDQGSLPIHESDINERNKVNQEKVEAMAQYASSKKQCRSRFLQAYFDEVTDQDCGVCDYCVEKKRSRLTIDQDQLLDSITEEGVELAQLVSKLGANQSDLEEVIRELVEKGEIELVNESLIIKIKK
ncbi:MAG: RecQ family ATP-dependent DNA helicase [Cyclobacteriaceae bacterium]